MSAPVWHTWKLADWAYETAENLELTHTELSVLLALAQYADRFTRECFPSQAKIAERCRYKTVPPITKALKSLQDKGVISRERRDRANGTRTSDQITVNAPVEVALRGESAEAATSADPYPEEPFSTAYERNEAPSIENHVAAPPFSMEEPSHEEPLLNANGENVVSPLHFARSAKVGSGSIENHVAGNKRSLQEICAEKRLERVAA